MKLNEKLPTGGNSPRTAHLRPHALNQGLGRSAQVAALQRLAGNKAVAASLQRQTASTAATPMVQRVELGVDYVVTGHGWDRINGRGISQTQLERTLDNPTVIHDDGSYHIYVSAFGGGNVCIRAVMSKDQPMAVVTVMKITGKKKVARYVDRP